MEKRNLDNNSFENTLENIMETTAENPKVDMSRTVQNDAVPQRRSTPQSSAPMRVVQEGADKTGPVRLNEERVTVSTAATRPVRDAGAVQQMPQKVQKAGDATKVVDTTKVTEAAKSSTKLVDTARKTGASGSLKKQKKKKKEANEASNTVMSLVKCMAYITGVFVISILLSVAIIFCANDKYAFVKSEDAVEITIPENATIDDVAKILHDNKIIKYKWLFKMSEGSFSGSFAAGTYSIAPMTSYDNLINTIREKPPTGISWITIPEGYTT